MKHMAEKGKIAAKKWGFRGLKGIIGVEKLRVGNQSRKVKWCKTQVRSLKTNKTRGAKG